jgi:phage terminase small subunit
MIRLTHRQRHFAEKVADGFTYSRAYRESYGCKKAKSSTIRTSASRLANTPKIAKAIDELLQAKERVDESPAESAIRTLLDEMYNAKTGRDRIRAAQALLRITTIRSK